MAWNYIGTVAFGGKQSMNQISFRLDDITADMNWDHFNQLDAIFSKYGIYPLLGVVPDNRDEGLKKQEAKPDFWERLKELENEGYTISQHGYQHVYETKNSGILNINPFSEFAGLPLEIQTEKLRQGQNILKAHQLSTDIFMAPGHTFDENTLIALKENGFKVITDGYTHYPYSYKGLHFYPSTLSEVREQRGVDTVCLHLNLMSEDDIKEVERFIQNHLDVVCSFKDMLTHTKVRPYTIFTALSIKKNLWVRELKNFTANNREAIEMMQRTGKMRKGKKILYRMAYIPKLLINFTKNKTGNESILEGNENDTGSN